MYPIYVVLAVYLVGVAGLVVLAGHTRYDREMRAAKVVSGPNSGQLSADLVPALERESATPTGSWLIEFSEPERAGGAAAHGPFVGPFGSEQDALDVAGYLDRVVNPYIAQAGASRLSVAIRRLEPPRTDVSHRNDGPRHQRAVTLRESPPGGGPPGSHGRTSGG